MNKFYRKISRECSVYNSLNVLGYLYGTLKYTRNRARVSISKRNVIFKEL